MPIEYRVDHQRQVVFAEAHGPLTSEDFFDYQADLGSHPELVAYNELVDMTDAVLSPTEPVRLDDLAVLSARTDPPAYVSRLAIVAPGDLTFGMARRYQTYRELTPGSTKAVGVFRTRQEALQWLGLSDEQA